ncbi:hypothetical protein QR680_008462 [Steinernema hermaphroditum]|uniref:Uncharacterized protein n=1 Tax=Steinernema hermaphroditum TaxID=289476 RepID=A0AA39M845_9BILA|nr:hypothetical protein QR680_008462 [Steinernema hermaphroditum]
MPTANPPRNSLPTGGVDETVLPRRLVSVPGGLISADYERTPNNASGKHFGASRYVRFVSKEKAFFRLGVCFSQRYSEKEGEAVD